MEHKSAERRFTDNRATANLAEFVEAEYIYRMLQKTWSTLLIVLATATQTGSVPAAGVAEQSEKFRHGQRVYNYYCYQCHGYSGDAATEAAQFVSPPPRNFSATGRDALTESRMVDSIRLGRPGTAMTSFGTTLNDAQIDAVVHYIREAFMTQSPVRARYHTARNGWDRTNGESDAAAFVNGDIALDSPRGSLSASQQHGKQLFLSTCITCHRGRETGVGETFGLRAVSYPRGRFDRSETVYDHASGASPYRLHDTPPSGPPEGTIESKGRKLFLDNCAFCHARDGTGRNWIGSFLEPRPRDLTAAGPVCSMGGVELRRRVADGIAGTSMPAWKQVLNAAEIDAIARYLESTYCG